MTLSHHHTLTLTSSHTHCHTITHSHIVTHSLSHHHTLIVTNSKSHTHCHTITYTSIYHHHTFIVTLSQTHCHTITHSPSHHHKLTVTLSHTHHHTVTPPHRPYSHTLSYTHKPATIALGANKLQKRSIVAILQCFLYPTLAKYTQHAFTVVYPHTCKSINRLPLYICLSKQHVANHFLWGSPVVMATHSHLKS